MLKGYALVTQTGGPTSVINASLAGVISQCLKEARIEGIWGCHFGVKGLLDEDFIDLSTADLEMLKQTPGSALGSSRIKLKEEDMPKVLEIFKKYNIRFYFGIGGDDTQLNVRQVEKYCREHGYEAFGMGCPKTVDNDLPLTDHTPGFPSAARYTALSVFQGGRLTCDMQKVDQFVIYQTIGRRAGWLAAAPYAFKEKESDPPHIILLPEIPFNLKKFISYFKECYEKFGYVSIICGEGVVDKNGNPISATQTKDDFGNKEFGAMGGASAAMELHKIISLHFPDFRGEFQITESLSMCADDRRVALDVEEAFMLGAEAARNAAEGNSGRMTALVREPGPEYKIRITTVPLEDVGGKQKPIPAEYIAENGMNMTPAFKSYIQPLVGPKPQYTDLDNCKRIIKKPK
ncbi:MAG: diphosphate--fructose-6-phosphate 1-phosphotransferase [Candidatus Neomarinimicrobiota bacterium]|jgi:6-phosphofructokinase 1|nr:diphosphate--fructose-6-phosphate 1-phosphotransferase [Candidatus Neomarinimicrobiota bacterium]MDD3965862.1 diphosphate--fructose-6-phosphate 1-phosphotransferase [Candidatus Neomarinimicrobiota bacterium]MDX9780072.1 diphosphate--fructose-6-phosphate 1-phosphotransferase [bacterium]